MAGLLSTGSPMLDIGLGLLAQSGPVVGAPAPSLGEAFGGAAQFAMNRSKARDTNELQRQQLAENQRIRQARDSYANSMRTGEVNTKVPYSGSSFFAKDNNAFTNENVGIATPEGQDAMNAMLFDISPTAYFANQTGKQMSAGMKDFMSLYPDLVPGSQNFADQYNKWANPTDQRDTLTTLQIEEILDQKELDDKAAEVALNQSSSNYNNTQASLSRIAESNTFLQGSAFPSGTRVDPGSFGGFANFITGDGNIVDPKVLIERGNFEVTTNELLGVLGEGLTNAQRQTLELSKPSYTQQPATNAANILKLVKKNYQDFIDLGSIPTPENIAEYEALIEQLTRESNNNWTGEDIAKEVMNQQSINTMNVSELYNEVQNNLGNYSEDISNQLVAKFQEVFPKQEFWDHEMFTIAKLDENFKTFSDEAKDRLTTQHNRLIAAIRALPLEEIASWTTEQITTSLRDSASFTPEQASLIINRYNELGMGTMDVSEQYNEVQTNLLNYAVGIKDQIVAKLPENFNSLSEYAQESIQAAQNSLSAAMDNLPLEEIGSWTTEQITTSLRDLDSFTEEQASQIIDRLNELGMGREQRADL